ncbi:type II toxin-antitoxin system antitoxin SocA domain-containing protein [uncultured Gemmiger sp.]|uniref:Panacea domain-containing protein n=1 Tax=uncultured Gemmiger sp. TaxID=1623490 RepID=UPI0025F70E01|nr:type II toxin-antitoxin system antitoxin SocA domain-containing protein [uncultured Gemmiger sp.]
MYTAMNIASEIIRQYGERHKSITNLKLQKILYYVQVYSLQNQGRALFDDDFQAWRHGPVIPEVYDIFRKYVSDDIKEDDQTVLGNRIEIDETSKSMIEKIVEKTLPLDAWDMVYKTHETRPWKDTYIPNMNCIITKEQIRRDGEVNLS